MTETTNGDRMEERILEAAKQVFIEKGYDEASMSDIAVRAGINRPALHYYFRTKEKMFHAVFGDIVRMLIPRIYDILCQRDRPIAERIANVVDIYYNEVFAQNPCLPMFVMREINRDAHHLIEMIKTLQLDQYAMRIRVFLLEEMKAGHMKNVPIHCVLFTFYGLLTVPFSIKNLASVLLTDKEQDFPQILSQWKEHIVRQMTFLLSNE